MRGQWIGPFKGTGESVAIIELDDTGDHFEGSAYAYSANLLGIYLVTRPAAARLPSPAKAG